MRKFLVAFVCLLASFGFALGKQSVSKTIVLQPGQTQFSVSLPANATTGYLWYVDATATDEVVTQKSYTYTAKKTKLMGAPGEAEFTFAVPLVKAPTVFSLSLVYRRAWEDTAPARTVHYEISAVPVK